MNVKLEIGRLEETVTVKSTTELVNTQTATVSSTLNADQLNRMPTSSRNALNAVTFLPGVNTAGVNRDSTVNGLPESMLNITLDGVSNQDNFNKIHRRVLRVGLSAAGRRRSRSRSRRPSPAPTWAAAAA